MQPVQGCAVRQMHAFHLQRRIILITFDYKYLIIMKLGAIRLLSRLRFRQFFRQKNKGLVGKIIIIAYFWFLELMFFFMIREEGGTGFPPMLLAFIFLGAIVPDALIKIIFEHDQTVMDPFIRTRPISQSSWDRFQSVSQFWRASNLAMPLIMAPACLLFMPIGWGLATLLVLYLFSVFGGFLVMLFKHRGNYPLEKRVSAKAGRSFRPGGGHHIFGIQSRSFLRSKRLKTSVFLLTGVFFFQFISQGLGSIGHFDSIFLCFTILYPSIVLAQWGMSIEANSFSAIWTKPVSISRLLTDKFLFSALIGVIAALITLPFCVWFKIPLYAPLAYALFNTGVGILFILVDAYNCMPFDLFGKTFFNYQGSASTFKASSFVAIFVVMLPPLILPFILPEWVTLLILAACGLAGLLLHRPYFRWVERKFLNNRYKYMEKYLSI